jgi:G:T-mismatch repair DNA endonuclease (very short patch repair protein)
MYTSYTDLCVTTTHTVHRANLGAQIDARERDIKELMAEGARLRAVADRATRDKASSEALYASLKRGIDAEQAGIKVRELAKVNYHRILQQQYKR